MNLVVGGGTATMTSPNGSFCPAQRSSGAFGLEAAHTITEVGGTLAPAGVGSFTTSIGAITCIPPTGKGAFDAGGDLPGPAAISAPGTITLCNPLLMNLTDLLCTQLGMCGTLRDIIPALC